jgi:hypothetical protein
LPIPFDRNNPYWPRTSVVRVFDFGKYVFRRRGQWGVGRGNQNLKTSGSVYSVTLGKSSMGRVHRGGFVMFLEFTLVMQEFLNIK